MDSSERASDRNSDRRDGELKSILSILYGDNIKVIFDKYALVWEKEDTRELKKGYIYTSEGKKLIDKPVDNVIPIQSNGNLVAYVIFLNNQLKELYGLTSRKCERVMRIDSALALDESNKITSCKIESRKYSKDHPDMILTYRGKKYLGKFIGKELIEFGGHG